MDPLLLCGLICEVCYADLVCLPEDFGNKNEGPRFLLFYRRHNKGHMLHPRFFAPLTGKVAPGQLCGC